MPFFVDGNADEMLDAAVFVVVVEAFREHLRGTAPLQRCQHGRTWKN
jgi:hypothetical protein